MLNSRKEGLPVFEIHRKLCVQPRKTCLDITEKSNQIKHTRDDPKVLISVTSNAACLKIVPNNNIFFFYTPL